MFSTRQLIQQSLRNVNRCFSSTPRVASEKFTVTEQGKPVVVVPMETPFLPDRAGQLPLNMIPQLNEIASFHVRNESVGDMFDNLEKSNLISIAKTQEIKIFPDLYNHWRTNDQLQIHCKLRDVGTKSFNIQFDLYDDKNTTILCRNIRSIVVCDAQMKPCPIPEDALDKMMSFAFHEERYFIPQPFKSKPEDVYETSTRVRPSDLDIYYHVNQANYLKFMLNAAVSAAKNGAYTSLKQDIAFALVDSIVLNYVRELCLDENIKIETWQDQEQPMKLCFEMSTPSKMAFQGSIVLQEPLVKLSDRIKRKFPRATEF